MAKPSFMFEIRCGDMVGVRQILQNVSDIEVLMQQIIPEAPAFAPENSALALIQSKDFYRVNVYINRLKSDLIYEVFFSLLNSASGFSSLNIRDNTFLSRLALELKGCIDSIETLSQVWSHVCDIRLELTKTITSLSRNEVQVLVLLLIKESDYFASHLVELRSYIEKIQKAILSSERAQKNSSKSQLKCPLTGQPCIKTFTVENEEVFVGFQFNSDYYDTTDLKIMIYEVLYEHHLKPFFADEHFEPIHISCEICYKLQQVSVCIFEISDSNPNVMFELGLAYMLGKAALLIAKNDSRGTKISDIAGFHRIQYEKLDDCRKALRSYFESSNFIKCKQKDAEGGRLI